MEVSCPHENICGCELSVPAETGGRGLPKVHFMMLIFVRNGSCIHKNKFAWIYWWQSFDLIFGKWKCVTFDSHTCMSIISTTFQKILFINSISGDAIWRKRVLQKLFKRKESQAGLVIVLTFYELNEPCQLI